jgi:hypothetical protein
MLKYQPRRIYAVLRYLLPALALLLPIQPAGAHFFGDTQEIDGYQVIFAPYPSGPTMGQNTTLNFSVLENGANLFNVYAAVKVQKSNGEVIFQDSYRQYEISDITVPYVFAEHGDYTVVLETRIPGHDEYESQPLTAAFPITAFPPRIPLDELLIYYVAPVAVAAAGIVACLHSKNMI